MGDIVLDPQGVAAQHAQSGAQNGDIVVKRCQGILGAGRSGGRIVRRGVCIAASSPVALVKVDVKIDEELTGARGELGVLGQRIAGKMFPVVRAAQLVFGYIEHRCLLLSGYRSLVGCDVSHPVQ